MRSRMNGCIFDNERIHRLSKQRKRCFSYLIWTDLARENRVCTGMNMNSESKTEFLVVHYWAWHCSSRICVFVFCWFNSILLTQSAVDCTRDQVRRSMFLRVDFYSDQPVRRKADGSAAFQMVMTTYWLLDVERDPVSNASRSVVSTPNLVLIAKLSMTDDSLSSLRFCVFDLPGARLKNALKTTKLFTCRIGAERW